MLAVCWAWCAAAAAGPALSLPDVENRLVRSSHLDALNAAYWAAAQGEAMVPLLAKLLDNRLNYQKEPAASTGAFPLNAVWALGRIPKSSALQALEKYYAASKDPMAALAIKGWKLRAWEQNPHYGVLAKQATLLEGPEAQARVLKRLKPGQKVRISQEKRPNPKEVSPRGGPVYYDRVDLIPSGEQGYLRRPEDDFAPFM